MACDLDFLDRPVALFDFDGTLVDTGPIVMRTARTVLLARGYSREETDDLTCLIGPPLVDGFRDCFHMTQREAEDATAEYRRIFDQAGPDEYPPMPGALELLDALRAQGRAIGIATSRLETGARKIAEDIDVLPRVDALAGVVPGLRRTKADSIAGALELLGRAPQEAFMVGDRHHDVEGAAELGIPCVGVYSGAAKPGELEGAGAALTVGGLDELLALIGGGAAGR